MITDRLLAMAKEVEEGESVADIGTDHGYLPMYLMEKGISPKVILTDVSRQSLKKARINCQEFMPETKFDFRQGNGLRVIKKGEVDVLTIAGMGGNLITEILGRDLGKARSCKKIIMQPRTSQGRLRAWLVKKGFTITKEQLVKEGKFICEVITAVPQEAPEYQRLDFEPDSIRWEFPSWMMDIKSSLVREFLDSKIERENRILTSMGNSKTIKESDIQAIKDNISYLESL